MIRRTFLKSLAAAFVLPSVESEYWSTDCIAPKPPEFDNEPSGCCCCCGEMIDITEADCTALGGTWWRHSRE